MPQTQTQTNNNATPPKDPISTSHLLPLTPNTTLHVQFTPFPTTNLIFLTTTTPINASSLSALGSFVYAIPNRNAPSSPPLSTPLFSQPSTLDFATRVAKIIAKRTRKPTYVGCSVAFPQGASVEEEIEGAKVAVAGILDIIATQGDGNGEAREVNGHGI